MQLPQPLVFHKPRTSGDGVALKLNLKYELEWGNSTPAGGGEGDARYLKKAKGGVFVDFAKQGPAAEGSPHPTFKWTDQASLVTAKLGLPDLSGLLVAYRIVRTQGQVVPLDMRPLARANDDDAARLRKQTTVAFTHQSVQAGQGAEPKTTILSYQFTAQGGVFRVSKARDRVGQVTLTLAEELRFMRYLELALDTALQVGGR